MKSIIKLSILELLFLSWSVIIILSIILSILNLFYPTIILIFIIIILLIILKLKNTQKIQIIKLTPNEKIILASLIILITILSIFSTPTIFGGRDEGALSNSAFLINKDHGLNHQSILISNFAKIYGEGKALNFPGFYYAKNTNHNFILKSQFLPGYSSYLANFAYASYPNALKFANALPLIIFLLSFYLITQQLTKSSKASLVGITLLASLTPLLLFYKFTLSEIFFASLLWPSLYFLIKYLKILKKSSSKDTPLIWFYWMIFLPLLPTVFIRIESFAIIFILILILILQSPKQLQKPRYQTPILLLILLSVLSLFLFNTFFIIALKGLLNSFINIETDKASLDTSSPSFIPKNWHNLYLLKLFYTYNLIPIFFFSILSIFKLIKEKLWFMLTPVFLLGLTGIYLIDANISIDHPWMLRRFIFSIFPLAILYTIIFFQKYPPQKTFLSKFIISLLIISNIFIAFKFVTFQQNFKLLNQLNQINNILQKNDLLLISQQVSGSGWSLVSEPLRIYFQKQAVYFFNPKDYSKIDKTNFRKIYLLTSEKELPLYKNNLPLKKIKKIIITNYLIQPSKDPLTLPNFIQTKTSNILYEIN